jgi:hypothetical protein
MSVLAVDLASRSWSDVGVALLSREQGGRISLEYRDLSATEDALTAEKLAERVSYVAVQCGARMILLDGPQGWREPGSNPPDRRECELALATPAKTGEPGQVKPSSYRSFALFSIEVFDGLEERGWSRWTGRPRGQGDEGVFAAEAYPRACWRALGLTPLPSKAKATASDLERARGQLRKRLGLEVPEAASHDQLQATIAGWAGIAWEARQDRLWQPVGLPPKRLDGHPREGFILMPRPADLGPYVGR